MKGLDIAFRGVFLPVVGLWALWMLCRYDGVRALFREAWDRRHEAGSWKS